MTYVHLWYEGPKDMKSVLEDAMASCGIFTGGSVPLYIRLYTNGENCALWIWMEGKVWDDFDSVFEKKDLYKELRRAFKEMGVCKKPPSYGFEVFLDEDNIGVRVRKQNVPLVLKRKESAVYRVSIDGEATNLTMGFRDVEGKVYFIGKPMEISTVKFFKGAAMVYPLEKGFAYYSKGQLYFPDGKVIRIASPPFAIWKGYIVMKNKVFYKGKWRNINSPVLDVFEGVMLESSGHLESVDGAWRMKISSTPVEWFFRAGKLYILDVCGFMKEIDLNKKEVLWEKRFPGAFGFDFLGDEILVATPGGVKRGDVTLEEKGLCVVKGKLEDGSCVRLHNGYGLRWKEGVVEILGNGLKFRSKHVIIRGDWLLVVGEEGIWAVRMKK